MSEQSNSPDAGAGVRGKREAGAFDIRSFVGLLLGIDGVVLLLTGIFGTSDAEIEKAAGVNANLWVGLVLIAAGLAFETWRRLRPVRLPVRSHELDEGREAAGGPA